MNSKNNIKTILFVLVIIIFGLFVFSRFTNGNGDVTSKTSSTNTETNATTEKEVDDLTTIMLEISKITETPDEIKDDVSTAFVNGATLYLKGKTVTGREISAEALKKISPLMMEKGFTITHKDDLGGDAQVGEEKYDNGAMKCSLMSGIFAEGFDEDISSFSFDCAYSKNSAPSYMEALEIETD